MPRRASAFDAFCRDAFAFLSRRRIDYLVIGGLAVIALGEPRTTGDVDVVVFVNDDGARALLDAALAEGFEQAEKERVRPVLEALGAERIFDFGEAPGAAVTVKLIGNFMIIAAAQTMTEGLSLAEKCGVDPRAVVEMLTTTLFAAPIYQSYGKNDRRGTAGPPEPDSPERHGALPEDRQRGRRADADREPSSRDARSAGAAVKRARVLLP